MFTVNTKWTKVFVVQAHMHRAGRSDRVLTQNSLGEWNQKKGTSCSSSYFSSRCPSCMRSHDELSQVLRPWQPVRGKVCYESFNALSAVSRESGTSGACGCTAIEGDNQCQAHHLACC